MVRSNKHCQRNISYPILEENTINFIAVYPGLRRADDVIVGASVSSKMDEHVDVDDDDDIRRAMIVVPDD